MRIVKTGDPCPLCGRPVTAEDRETLDQLTAIAQMLDRFGIDIDVYKRQQLSVTYSKPWRMWGRFG